MRVRNVLLAGAAGTVAAGTIAGVGAAMIARAAWKGLREIRLRGKVALVTGASRGIGLAIARELARDGAHLVICARHEEELRWAQEELQAMGGEVMAIVCDVGDREQVRRMFEQIRERYGALDVLVNNAGQISVGPIHSQTVEDFEEAMRVMFWGSLYPTLEAMPAMLARKSGHIANITSIGGKVAIPHLLPYSVAKFATVGFSEGLHAELAKDGVKVTTVVPGLMRTGSHVNAYFKGDHRKEYAWFSLAASTPLTSMNAQRAARKIVTAVKRGKSEIVLTWQAQALAWAHGVAPGATTDVLGMANRMIPGNRSHAKKSFTGKESRNAFSDSIVTELGRRAGIDLHQYPETRKLEQEQTSTDPAALLAD